VSAQSSLRVLPEISDARYLEAVSSPELGQPSGSKLREARQNAGLSQQDVADRVGKSQVTVSNWELGVSIPGDRELALIQTFLDLGEDDREGPASVDPSSAFGDWLEDTRRQKRLTRRELSEASGISEVQIGNIERGATRNPRHETQSRLQRALEVELPEDIKAETVDAAEIPGLGTVEDFDPHAREDWPTEAGVYVLYDVSERPVYVGKSGNVAGRLADHQDKFWYKAPIVQSASFIKVPDADLRHQLEQVMIKFLKSNAVINQQSVQR